MVTALSCRTKNSHYKIRSYKYSKRYDAVMAIGAGTGLNKNKKPGSGTEEVVIVC
jgi:hypothetical protein